MARKINDISRALHIKKHTQGTSNEVSLNVLEAQKEELDGNKDEVPRFRLGRISLFTLPVPKKPQGTPTKEDTLFIKEGEAVSVQQPDKAANANPVVVQPTAAPERPHTGKEKHTGKEAQRDKEKKNANNAKQIAKEQRRANKQAAKEAHQASRKAHKKAKEKPVRSPEEEIAWRKKRRRRMRIGAGICAGVLAIAVVAACCWYAYDRYQSHESTMSNLDQALLLIDQADEAILPFDEILSDPRGQFSVSTTGSLSSETSFSRISEAGAAQSVLEVSGKTVSIDASSLVDARAKAEEAKDILEEAKAKAQAASSGLQEEEEGNTSDQDLARQAIEACEAREAMIDAALAATDTVQSAAECAEVSDIAWEKVIEGDDLARESSSLLADGTEANIQASKEKSEAATLAFDQATYIFTQAQELYTEANLSSFLDYLAKRKEAMEYAIASDTALLERNKEGAQTRNEAYLAADNEAVEMAKTLPTTPSESVYQSYQDANASLVAEYDTARSRASSADDTIRNYLDTQGT